MAYTFNDFKRDFGANLRRLRKKIKENNKGSAEDLSNYSDLSSEAYILSVERGEKDIKLSTLFKLAAGLKIDPKDLLDFPHGTGDQDDNEAQKSPIQSE